MKTIYLFRHSKPDKSADEMDPPLSVEGEKRMAKLVERLKLNTGLYARTSPLRRARETAAFFGGNVTVDERLAERAIGDKASFTKELWMGQYVDADLRDDGGESFRMVRERMNLAMEAVLKELREEESAAVVSHAASICAWLQQFCEITVVAPESKERRIVCNGDPVLDGKLETPCCFELVFDDGMLARVSYHD